MEVYYRGQRLAYQELAEPLPRKCEVEDRSQRQRRGAIVRQAAQAESGSSLATRLPHHEAELAGEAEMPARASL